VTDIPTLSSGSYLDFNCPLSPERAERLVRDLAATTPSTVIDFGCGWGELMLRLIDATAGATGAGIDTEGPDTERGRTAADRRGLSDRVTFVAGEAAAHDGTADVVISIGAYHAFGTIPEALAALRARVRPGGRLLFGAEFWERTPPPERLERMWPGITADDCMELPELVDAALTAGFGPLRIETVTRGEWEEFESRFAAEGEQWLLDNADHPKADEVRAKLDVQRSIWLRGHRDYMGFTYLTLGVPA
jgi:SAM-dependent methyltransferase